MKIEIGRISELFRYPVKSMAGESLAEAQLGWHGIEGDRRFALHRKGDTGGFPWLTAGRLPELLLYRPFGGSNGEPTHIRTPSGDEYELYDPALAAEISGRFGSEVELMRLKHGIFDEGQVSAIALATIRHIEAESGIPLDIRRFRPNIAIETVSGTVFGENDWEGGTLTFEDSEAAVTVTMRDLRCSMINFDPDTVENSPQVLKTVGRLNQADAGVYGTVVRAGALRVGQTVWLQQ